MERSTLADRAFEVLTERIASGKIRPGDPLKEGKLAEELDLSRTPVRSAIERLSAAGLVERRPYHTPTVVEATFEKIKQAFQVREAIEPMTARLMAQQESSNNVVRGLRDICDEMKRAMSEEDWSPRATSDFLFHRYMIGHCGNELITRGDWAQGAILISFFSHKRCKEQKHRRELEADGTGPEHGDIVDAIEAREPAKAEAAARKHVRQVWRRVKHWNSENASNLSGRSE